MPGSRARSSLKAPLRGGDRGVEDQEPERTATRSSGRTEIRILFAFDPWQQIVLLLAGDKSSDWRGWYSRAIPRAEELYADHLEAETKDRKGGK
jgi:hypothetical protein